MARPKIDQIANLQTQLTSTSDSANNRVLKTGDTMTGELTVSVASSANAVRITQTGGGNALVVEDSANPDASPFIIDAGGQLIQGYTTAINNWNLAPDTFALHSSSSNARPSTGLYNWSTNTARVGTFAMYKSISGVVGTNSALAALGQQFGRIAFCGDDGTSFIRGAEIIASVDGTVGANSMPGKLDFRTTAAGASSPTTRMSIDANGNIGIGNTAPGSKLTVAGTVESTSGGIKFPDGTTQTTAAASVTGIPSLNIVTGTAVTAIISNHYALTNAAQTSVTLPASPSSGDLVWVTVENGLANNVIIRNGNKIKGLSENLVMDIANVGIQLRYVNANVGWTIN